MPSLLLALCGDIMTGRGIDQVLPHPGDPCLWEPQVTSAVRYVELAEALHGPIGRPVDFAYIWGDALTELDRVRPDARIVNLETSITSSSKCWPKAVHYRMNPANVPCITLAGLDCCGLANNHAMDFGYDGLAETLSTLRHGHVPIAGAGRDIAEAEAPAIKETAGKGRIVVFCFGSATAGIPARWAAGPNRPGINLLPDLSQATVDRIAGLVGAIRRVGDVVVASIHWGENWGYQIHAAQSVLAHRLVDSAGIDVVYGHSSHHAKAVELYAGKLILYGCGDFIDDYEGIAGYEEFRDDLRLMYLATVDASHGCLIHLALVPFQIRAFRLNRATHDDASWLCDTLSREGKALGTRFILSDSDTIELMQ